MQSAGEADGDDASEFFLEHARSTTYAEELESATHTATVLNPACGDEVRLQLHIDCQRVQATTFQHQGCTVSRAAASILSEHLRQ